MVRGFWGDILQSPYVGFGLEIWKEPERSKFFKELNFQQVYSSMDACLFNVQYYIQKLEDTTEYDFPFERIKQIKERITEMADGKKEDEPKTQEVTDEEAKEIGLMDKLKGKTVDLTDVVEGDEAAGDNEGDRVLLQGFRDLNVKIHLLADKDLLALRSKKKFKGLFDCAVLGLNSANFISTELSELFRDKARVHVETSDYLILLKAEQRLEMRKAILKKMTEAKWENIDAPPYKHHFLFEVNNDAESKAGTPKAEVAEEDDDVWLP